MSKLMRLRIEGKSENSVLLGRQCKIVDADTGRDLPIRNLSFTGSIASGPSKDGMVIVAEMYVAEIAIEMTATMEGVCRCCKQVIPDKNV